MRPFGPKCPKSVPGVSQRCPDTPGTLSGHFLDTLEPGAQRAPGTPRGTLPWTPPFSGTLSGTLWARRAQKSPVGGRALRNSHGGAKLQPSAPRPVVVHAYRSTGNSLKTLTSLNKEVRPFFLSDNSIWSLPSVFSP